MRLKYPLPVPPHVQDISTTKMGIQVVIVSGCYKKTQMDIPLTARHRLVADAIKRKVRKTEPEINTMSLVQVDQKFFSYQYSFRNK